MLKTLTAFLLASATAVSAQTLTPDELKAMIDKELGGQNEYLEIMDDADPRRSAAAVKIMMASGDPELERMAREYALFSPHPIIQRTALQAFFDSAPNLEIYLDGSALDNETYKKFASFIVGQRGSNLDDKNAFFLMQLGKFDEAKKCWVNAAYQNYCLIHLSENQATVSLLNKAAPLRLNDDGILEGSIEASQMVPIRIPVTR